MGNLHLSVWPGKRVMVKLRDGTIFEDRFVEKKARFVILQTHGKIRNKLIKSLSITK